jgi:hypothetical protein
MTKIIITDLAQVSRLKSQTLTGNHGSGSLTTTLLSEIEHLKLAVKLREVRNNTEVIYRI